MKSRLLGKVKKRIRIILINLTSSRIAGLFFRLTKKRFTNDKSSRWANAWWYGYLLNFALRFDVNTVRGKNLPKRRVKTLMPDFDWFLFYNTVFQLDCISHIVYELAMGYIPLIDDTWGVWKQFFEQPVESLKENERMEDIGLSDEPSTLYTPTLIPYCKKVRKLWTRLIYDYCRLNENEKQYIENECRDVLGKGNRVLAVVCRGTDYKTANMEKQPEVCDVIALAEKWMSKYNYDKIYLATEEEAIFDQFEKAFPGKILVNKRTYYDKAMKDQNVKWIGQVKFDRENDDYLKGLEYLSSIIIVSRCKALMGGYCGASNMALLYNGEQYERYKIF